MMLCTSGVSSELNVVENLINVDNALLLYEIEDETTVFQAIENSQPIHQS